MRILAIFEQMNLSRGNFRIAAGFINQIKILCESYMEVDLSKFPNTNILKMYK